MSRSTTQTFTCPCGEVFKSPIYEYVNVAQDPQLRYVVLAGLLNVSTCPQCGRRAAVAHPFIYSDSAHTLLVYVEPRTDVPEEARQLILERLRSAYTVVTATQEQQPQQTQDNGGSEQGSILTQAQLDSMPPLRVVFGLDQL
ncbi:MAG TPA: CpXC domain-containing protein, partial [Ktedonobacteraceae bacterium]|nr:CpXC domain-containing protein [Ktedonobacteraceae bacterium]